MKRNLSYLALALLCTGIFLVYLMVYHHRLDTKPPTITFSQETMELSASAPEAEFLLGVTATDDVDGDVTDSLVIASVHLVDQDGTIEVTYAAFDAAGNVTRAVRKARFTDYESPRFSLSRSLTFALNSGFDIFNLVNAHDAMDGDISHRVRISLLDSSSITAVGVHQAELRVSNSLGETASLVIPVEVYATGIYDATVTLRDYLIYLPAGSKFNPQTYLSSYTHAGNTVSLVGGVPAGYKLDIKSDVQPDVPGVYTVEYRVTQTTTTGDGSVRNYTGYAKLIVVVEG